MRLLDITLILGFVLSGTSPPHDREEIELMIQWMQRYVLLVLVLEDHQIHLVCSPPLPVLLDGTDHQSSPMPHLTTSYLVHTLLPTMPLSTFAT
jgi:hypothetical protein